MCLSINGHDVPHHPITPSPPLPLSLSVRISPSHSLFFIVMPESPVYLAIALELALNNKFVS